MGTGFDGYGTGMAKNTHGLPGTPAKSVFHLPDNDVTCIFLLNNGCVHLPIDDNILPRQGLL
jgi:hypothetical protein